MDDTRSLTFDDSADDLGAAVYINCQSFTKCTESMNHFEDDEFNSHLDELIEASNRTELAKFPFIFLSRPDDYDRQRYCAEPIGQEHIELRVCREEAAAQTAVYDAEHHFYLMSLCGHPEEEEKLRNELTMSAEELCKIRGSGDLQWVGRSREHTASILRQVERMKQKYSLEEIRKANEFLDDTDRQLSDIE